MHSMQWVSVSSPLGLILFFKLKILRDQFRQKIILIDVPQNLFIKSVKKMHLQKINLMIKYQIWFDIRLKINKNIIILDFILRVNIYVTFIYKPKLINYSFT